MYKCQYGKEFEKANSLNAHYSHCKIHKDTIGSCLAPNRIPGANKGKMNGWDKFTENDLKIFAQKSGKSYSDNIKSGKTTHGFKGKRHTEETKDKLRKTRYKYLSNGKQQGAFDKSKLTYIENWFNELIIRNNLTSTYNIEYNYSFYPYLLDFAFTDIKLDVEVDGSFHYKYDINIKHDKIRNEYLESKDWKVFRISIDEVNGNSNEIENEFLKYLENYSVLSKSRYYTI